MLIDNHNRQINYLRLAVTDRCNLRCHYCMPAEGIAFAKNDRLLSMEELKTVSRILVGQGIDKIRITGGEPFVRKDLMELLRYLANLKDLKETTITTNATLIGPYITELKNLGITKVNVSMDAINRETFDRITRRESFEIVYENLTRLLTEGFQVRINCIVLDGQNIEEILPMLELTKHYPVSVRFLEEMPFNGGSKSFQSITWDHRKILAHILETYPAAERLESHPTSTSINYKIPGHEGTFGLIPSFSRTFCGSCNRLRISATGDVITCLYGKPSANVRDILRANTELSEEALKSVITTAISQRAKTGFEAQQAHTTVFESSMTSIGG